MVVPAVEKDARVGEADVEGGAAARVASESGMVEAERAGVRTAAEEGSAEAGGMAGRGDLGES